MEQTLTESYIIGRPMTGEQVGNYLLLHELGRGGYAQVYLAEHLYLKQLVALKLLKLSLNQHEDLVRFQFEARLLAQLQHRHIVRALNFDWEVDRPFLAMDYAPGGTIQQIFQQGAPQPLFRILPVVLQIARALQYAHNHHVIHCDVKPENILLGPRNEVWLADFGIATTMGSLPRTSYGRQAIRGTVRYMAPEQIQGTPLPTPVRSSTALARARPINLTHRGTYHPEGDGEESPAALRACAGIRLCPQKGEFGPKVILPRPKASMLRRLYST